MQLAAESVNRQADDVATFSKLAEGGFNRTFLATMKDGFKLVARIPYLSTQPRRLLIASEVATLGFLRSNGLPVPEVYGYSAVAENPAGTEYMFLEFIGGINLGDIWYDLSEQSRLKFLHNLVDFESRLFDLRFPASGSLYCKKDMESLAGIDIPSDASSDTAYCIGADTSQHLWHRRGCEIECSRGPCMYLSTSCSNSKIAYRSLDYNAEAALTAGAEKELAYIRKFGRPLHPYNKVRRELYGYQKLDPRIHITSIQTYLQIAHLLIPKEREMSEPTIRHPDLQPSNIFVSATLDIVGVIDWQHAVILPLFLQSGIPDSLQNYSDPVSDALTLPSLPANIDSLEAKQQLQEQEILRKRQLHYHYFRETAMQNPVHQAALMVEMAVLRRKIFRHASDPWEGDNISLQADIVQLQKFWLRISSAPCPLSHEQHEAAEILRLSEAQQDADNQLVTCYEAIGVGKDGWVPAEHYKEARQRALKFKEDAFADEDDEEDALAKEHWIFDDFDEDEYE